ncbi:MAG: ribonuclease HIII [Bulleidia sp.]|nr:ribonuclease HIII [Bulleidia sp.]
MANSITLNLTSSQENQLYTAYSAYQQPPVPYSKWRLKLNGCVITCYQSGKTLFQGENAEKYAKNYISSTPQTQHKTVSVHQSSAQYPQAGSDEVGTGDYLGPVVVASAYVDESHVHFLESLGVKDSKAVTDKDIENIGKQIIEVIPHSVLIVSNRKYNAVHSTTNLNAIKAKLHNQAYVNLSKKVTLPALCVVDQFAEKGLYYHYLKDESQVIRTLHFETKAENKYLSVGTASIIARYTFLEYWKKMEEHYAMTFYKGAGDKVNACAREFIEKYGEKELSNIAKLHFKNTEIVLKKQ